MTDTLPRPIEPGEIRVGDRVQVTHIQTDRTVTTAFTVSALGGDRLYTPDGEPIAIRSTDTWILVHRPTPAPAAGSRWRDENSGDEFVLTDRGMYARYKGGIGFLTISSRDAASVARLTPIPDHGDGCSEWLWDPETGTAWVAGNNQTGNVTHLQVHGQATHMGCLIRSTPSDGDVRKRLVPWSERGQANG